MPKHTCVCGARYRFPQSAVGKRAKCQKCGAVFTLEPDSEGPIPIADEPPMMDDFAAAAERARAAAHTGGQSGPVPTGAPPVVVIEPASQEKSGGVGGYFLTLLSTFVFVKSLHNLVVFIVVWALLCVSGILLPAAPFIGAVGIVIILGWYCAFRFGVILEAASGEQDLPGLNPTEGAWDDIILPLFRWIGSWVIVVVPAVVALVAIAGPAALDPSKLSTMFSGGVSGMVQAQIAAGAIAFVVLLLMGVFMWPLLALCIAIGGFATVSRVDLIFATMFKTFPIYLLTVAIVFGTSFVDPVLQGLLSGSFVGRALAIGVELYLEIIALRAIGLYYCHFKHRFAWSWD